MTLRRIFLSALCTLAVVSIAAAADWQALGNCTLISSRYNDGDSFHCNCGGKEYIFRLLAIDAPETDDRFEDRVADQAKYFGITEDQAIEIGKQAKEFTASALETNTFYVLTKGQAASVQGKIERSYAFVVVDGEDLGRKLVEHGLARIHGITVTPPGVEKALYEQVLVASEKQAKDKRLGAWAFNAGGVETNGYRIAEDTGYKISKSGIRHNSKCRYYDSLSSAPCGKDDGRPCKICGG